MLGAGDALRGVRDAADGLFVRLGRPPLRTRTDGVVLRGFLRHRSFLEDVSDERHEPFLRTLLLNEIGPETTFVDVGAHVGLYALLAAPHAREVVAFEADPYTARALRANTARIENVRVVAKAASSRAGRVQFFQSPGTYGSSLFRRPSMRAETAIEVEATTVDAEVAGAHDLVAKVDAEGAELDVLAGMTGTLARARRTVLLIEVNPVALGEAGRSPAELLAELRRLGLDLARVDERTGSVEPLATSDTGDWKGNVLCRRAS